MSRNSAVAIRRSSRTRQNTGGDEDRQATAVPQSVSSLTGTKKRSIVANRGDARVPHKRQRQARANQKEAGCHVTTPSVKRNEDTHNRKVLKPRKTQPAKCSPILLGEPQNKEAGATSLPRCLWAQKSERTQLYHDTHWGHPVREHGLLFEVLSLCSQQAGVSWRVVWDKRKAYRAAFHDFDMDRVASMTNEDIESIVQGDGNPKTGTVIRNRKKLLALVNNARILREKHSTHPEGLAGFLWSFVPQGKPIVNKTVWKPGVGPSVETDTSKAMAKEFKLLGFSFVGSITLNAFLQQCGLINDHCRSCYKNPLSESYTS